LSTRRINLEQNALQLIFNSEGEGLIQSEMWKELGVSSREVSRLVLKFEEKGIIERRRVLHNGRWTYRLYSKRQYVTLNSIYDCPCLTCEEIDRCFPRGAKTSISCNELTKWIEVKTKKSPEDCSA
jgi:DNA-binding MarR family transcriptional regulator